MMAAINGRTLSVAMSPISLSDLFSVSGEIHDFKYKASVRLTVPDH
ncbi:MAG: hypothetical protein KKD24_02670 [Proteobacteria bacterium]|nr:hypothetical protein [Pseudomonadota bacterium]